MAEIKIEKKKVVWPWVLIGLLILAVILYFAFFNNNNEMNDNVAEDRNEITAPAKEVNNEAVDAYITYVNIDTAKMGLDHTFTRNALIKLIEATKVTADKQNVDIKADLDKATDDANKITDDPMSTTHADYIKDATGRISSALQNIQQAKFPDLNAESKEVTDASAQISTADLTLDQKSIIHEYFNDAATLLKKMN